MNMLKNVSKVLTGLLSIGTILLLGLSGISGKHQDRREEKLVIQNKYYKNILKIKEERIDKLVCLLKDVKSVTVDTVVIKPEPILRKVFIPLVLTQQESLNVARIYYSFIYNEKRDSVLNRMRTTSRIIILKGRDTIKK